MICMICVIAMIQLLTISFLIVLKVNYALNHDLPDLRDLP